jgi:phosphoenolpyruvate-protein phosphotransferase
MKTIKGIGASEGIAIAPTFWYLPELPPIERRKVDQIDVETQRLASAIAKVDTDLMELKTQLEKEIGHEKAAIFEAHRMILSDKAFVGRAHEIISNDQINAEAAVNSVMHEFRQTFEAMEDEYFRERAMDVVDVGRRLLRAIMDLPQPSLAELPHPCIVLANDLTPSDTARMDRKNVRGFCTARGGKTAHAAILARSLGIPAVVGAGAEILDIPQDHTLILDGQIGTVIVEPDEATLSEYEYRRTLLSELRAKAMATAHEPAVSLDGRQVEIVANIGTVEEAEQVLKCGGEGVGLLRTEFLFIDRTTPPDEDEQTNAYRTIAEVLGERPLIIRTLDIGGDKPLPYLPLHKEENPFLGQRGIRLCLAMPDMFKIQLRAILRAADGYDIKIMFPMVAHIDELRAAKVLLQEAHAELDTRNVPYGEPDIGIMIEIPAAALTADILAKEVDFFSIGTNDLTQYTLAADRTNALVQDIADALHPAVLRLIDKTIRHAHEAGIWVGLCGELAGDPVATPVLLGLELDEFSMAPNSIPFVKQVIRCWSVEEARQLANEILLLDSEAQVRERVEKFQNTKEKDG